MSNYETQPIFAEAPTAIKVVSLYTLFIGMAVTGIGGALLADIIEIEGYESTMGMGFIFLGVIISGSSIGLYRLMKVAWILYLSAAILFIGLIMYNFTADLAIKFVIVLIGFILGDLLAENEFFLRRKKVLKKLRESGVDTQKAPDMIRFIAFITILVGFGSIVLGALTFPIKGDEGAFVLEQYDPLHIAAILLFFGLIFVFLGSGLLRMSKIIWFYFIFIGFLFAGTLIYLNIDDAIPKLLIFAISLVFGDLIAENEFFIKPDYSPFKKASRFVYFVLYTSDFVIKIIISCLALLIGFTFFSLYMGKMIEDETFWKNIVLIFILFEIILATMTILYKASISQKGHQARRLYWGLFIAWAFYLLGEFTWSGYFILLEEEPPFPYIPDIFWIFGTLLLINELILYTNSIEGKLNPKVTGFFFVIFTGLVLALLYFSFWEVMISEFSEDYGPYAKSVDVFYFVLDVFIIYATGLVMLKQRSKIPLSWLFLTIGMICMILGDSIYTYLEWGYNASIDTFPNLDFLGYDGSSNNRFYRPDDLLFVFQYMFWVIGAAFMPIKLNKQQIR